MNTLGYPNPIFPPYFEIETIRACNARCIFCPFGTGQISNSGPMATGLYNKLASEIIEHRDEVKRVTLAVYSEPLLDRHLAEKISGLKRGGIAEVAITTNASLLDEERAIELLNAGVDITRLSISTIDPEKYAKLRVGLDFATVMKNAERYIRARDRINPDSKIYVSMEKHGILTGDNIETWKKYWSSLMGQNDMLKVTIYYDRIIESRQSLGCDRKREPCHAIFQTLDVAYSGHALFCSADFKAGASPYVLGDLNRESIVNVWNSDRARMYRDLHRSGQRNEIEICRGCDIWDVGLKENYVFGDGGETLSLLDDTIKGNA